MADLAGCTVAPDATLRDAIAAIDRGGAQIALVADRTGKLIGILTDGDIRRALLKGATLPQPLSPFVRREFTSVMSGVPRSDVLDLMQARSIEQVPVLDDSGVLVGLHLLRELLGAQQRPNWAVVMAGGRGQRLRPITDSIPKPMIRVAGRPILERIVLHLVGFGIRRIYLSVNYMAEVIEEHFQDGQAHGCEIQYLRESHPLGTAGALSLLPEQPHHPILVLNGDLLTQVHLGELLEFHERERHHATVAVTEYAHTVPFGVVEMEGNRIVDMAEKPSTTWWTNAGIYALSPDVVGRVKRDEELQMPGLIGDCIGRGESVGAFRIVGDWLDVGRPDELKKARGQ